MSLNAVPSSQRVTIGFFGRRNAGKSSLMNAVAGQALAVVSPVKGTTTDPVKKAMELLPFGPVVLIGTPGIDDDQGDLGGLRVEKTPRVRKPVAQNRPLPGQGQARTPVTVGKKIGRNDPCPCGSGKKYKNCCGAEGAKG